MLEQLPVSKSSSKSELTESRCSKMSSLKTFTNNFDIDILAQLV